ncbi:hypothetical protein J502_1323 [Acinetobacter sp. 1294596]|nr:hypothetical protein J502_1323 [Acinetobacter sp. 1294596]
MMTDSRYFYSVHLVIARNNIQKKSVELSFIRFLAQIIF